MSNRAALLPHPADPFLFKYWLKFFNNVWGEEVDKLYICLNSPMEKEVIDYMKGLVASNPKIDLLYVDHQLEHGTAINMLLDRVVEPYLMLIEDDGFIFKKGAVTRAFHLLETNQFDIVASPRGSCSQEIWDRARDLWGLNYDGMGDVGCNFWPNFFFGKADDLRNTDRNFASRAWKQGERIEALDYVVKEEICVSDTFVNTSLQLRAKGLRIKEIPQYHASPDDMDHLQRGYNLFDGICPWVHVGSLSSGVHGVLMDDKGRRLARRKIDPEGEETVLGSHCNSEGEKLEWERRVAFWMLFLENAEVDPIQDFKRAYALAIERIITQYALSVNRINKRIMAYKTLGL